MLVLLWGCSSSQPVVDAYFETPWQPIAVPRLPLPVALDLGGLYEQMLRQHMLASPRALASRAGEALVETVERGNQIHIKRRAVCLKALSTPLILDL